MAKERLGVLALSRHTGQAIRIGDDIEIIVLNIRGDIVRLGIRADRSVPVHREEIYQAIQKEKRDGDVRLDE